MSLISLKLVRGQEMYVCFIKWRRGKKKLVSLLIDFLVHELLLFLESFTFEIFDGLNHIVFDAFYISYLITWHLLHL